MSDSATTNRHSVDTGSVNGSPEAHGDALPSIDTPRARRRWTSGPALLILALLLGLAGGVGGFAIANSVWDTGSSSDSSFTVQPSNSGSAAPKQGVGDVSPGTRMTPGEIYTADSPGVVHVTSQITVTNEHSIFGIPQEQERRGHRLRLRDRPRRPHRHQRARRRDADAHRRQFQRRPVRSRRQLVGEDTSTDIAVIKVDARRPSSSGRCTRCRSATPRSVQVGDPVVAIGNPFNLDRTLTTGVVSALATRDPLAERRLRDQRRDPDRRGDQPGQLGWPAAQLPGQVIGVNSPDPVAWRRQRRHRVRRALRRRCRRSRSS